MPSETCALCRYWRAVDDADADGNALGQYRRFPPSYEGWPMTEGADWCGEWLADA